MLSTIEGDLFNSTAQVIVNAVNTDGVMGSGIALIFKRIYPDMYKAYQEVCRTKALTVGKLWLYKAPDRWILAFPTKSSWRLPSKLDYIEAGLIEFVKTYQELSIESIAFPKLGCGKGGLSWEEQVQPLMTRYLSGLSIPVFIHLL